VGGDRQQSRPDAGNRLPQAPPGGLGERQLPEPLPADPGPVRPLHGGPESVAADRTHQWPEMAAAGRLLLHRIRPSRLSPHILRRSRHPLGRSPENGERSEHPPRRHRASLQERFFQTDDRPERATDRGVCGKRFLQHAAGNRAGRPRKRGADLPGPAREDALCEHLGDPRGARLPLPAGHRHLAKHASGPEDHGTPLLRRTEDEDRAGDSARNGRRPASQKAGNPPPCLSHQRGAFRLHALRADRFADEGGGALPRRGRGSRPREHRLYDPHPGGGRKRAVQPGADGILFLEFREVDGNLLVPVLGAGKEGERRGEVLFHDDPRPEDVPQKQRRQPRSRAGFPPDVARGLEGVRRIGHPDRPHHQRRPCALLHRPPDENAAGHLPRAGLGPAHHRSRTLGAHPGHPRHRPLADPV